MTPEAFVSKWQAAANKERASAQEHFLDLCRLLGVPTPIEADPTGDTYTFERHVAKVTGGKGFADVWFRGHFALEYKGKGADLKKAYTQLLAYREDLENPPLLMVSDLSLIEVHTNFTGTQKQVETFTLEDLLLDAKRAKLREAWTRPGAFDPTLKRDLVTEAIVRELLAAGDALKARTDQDGTPLFTPDFIAHFLVKCVFTLFAEDAKLLPRQTFGQLLEAAAEHPEDFRPMCVQLFSLMSAGGVSVIGRIPHVNGEVFSDASAPDLTLKEIQTLQRASRHDWTAIDPSIFGTLFERIIDPAKRAQLGAHYTPLADILDVVEPVVMTPLRREWEAVRSDLAPLVKTIEAYKPQGTDLFDAAPLWEEARRAARERLEVFQNRLAGVHVLDPAMGSGNFLYVTLRLLLDLEAEVRATLRLLTDQAAPVKVSPKQMRGLEVSPYAHEIAGMVLWIGFLQWQAEHGEPIRQDPLLEKLAGLENRDAVLEGDKPADWPEAEFIVGNPPFLGNYKMRGELGNEETEKLRKAYEGRVPGFADLVCYWFEKAREQIEAGETKRAGLIATNSIRGGANRKVLERIKETGDIFRAWPDRAWFQDGAAVRVSVVCFDDGTERNRVLCSHAGREDDPMRRQTVERPVSAINPDLTSSADLSQAKRLKENSGKSFEGVKPAGKFDVPGSVAREWLELPNPSGASNADVLREYVGGDDITEGSKDRWIVDFNQMSLEEAKHYRQPMEYVISNVKTNRDSNREKNSRVYWWRFQRTRPELRSSIAKLNDRFIATVKHAKYRIFVWLSTDVLPGNALAVITVDDDYTFGVLNSIPHTFWALRQGTSLEDRPRYTSDTTFETFPFPHADEAQREQIAQAARYLEQCRAYLKGKGLTLTGMYNALSDYRSSGNAMKEGVRSLADAHAQLDEAVAAAYGWTWPLGEDEVLGRLLALNLERAGAAEAIPT